MSQNPYDLRNRNPSQIANGDTENDKEEEEEDSTKKKEKKLVTVINMKDFMEVNTDKKLNLLMCAINKMNANFHLKLEEIQASVRDDIQILTDKISNCESNYKAVHTALNDEQEGVLP